MTGRPHTMNPGEPVSPPSVPASVLSGRRRRRPAGTAAPLPRSLGMTGGFWLVALGFQLAWVVAAATSSDVLRLTDRVDAAIARPLVRARTGWLTAIVEEVDQIGSGWLVTIVGLGLLMANMIFKRWRHLFTFLVGVAVIEVVAGDIIYHGFERPRPYDVTIVGRWAGFSLPSPPVGVVTILAIGICYTLVLAGRPRTIAKIVSAVVVTLFAACRVYLGVDHPFDAVVAVSLSVAILVNAFRWFTPNESFPVSYRRGKTAHLDIGGVRGEAIRRAVREQMGLTVIDVKPVGLEGSGGSTPLRLRIAGTPDRYLFGKLYAMSHVRSDRWYKLGRTILYGRLEDEGPFQSVRRLVQYEDYTARVLHDAGIPTAAPYGIVELTPEREYLLVTEFFDGAEEIGEAEVDDRVIDEALGIVRQLWDAGLAHRDIKPANLLVRDGRVILIDVFFVQIRPSPWRQAVDLANMMLVLAVRTDAPRVYHRALRLFTEDELAEAFAAVRGIASPTQLRMAVKRDPRNLVAEFRALAPHREPVALQRWSVKRVMLALGVLLGAVIAVAAVSSMFRPVHNIGVHADPFCERSNVMILMAQSVPTATALPCVASLPGGWEVSAVRVDDEGATIWLDSDIGGERAVAATLRPPLECSVTGAVPVASDEVGIERYEQPQQLPPDLISVRTYLFEGGCVVYEFRFSGDVTAALTVEVDEALSFLPRSELVDEVDERSGLRLCGAGVACTGS
jgi:tRNA A-37 threonylcarbamoyl transferase component Bud32/membrane-associated phospholipid phosphatase